MDINIKSLFRDRRSTFIRGLMSGGKIEDKTIEDLLDNAIWAPTHGLTQSWFFRVYAGRGVVSFFLKQQEIYKEITPPDKFNHKKFDSFPEKAKKVSHIIAVIAKRDPKKRYPKQEDIVSVSCALQNIYLSLAASGIAGYLSTGDICYASQMREFLELGKDDECLGFFNLGIADKSISRTSDRDPASEKTVWIRN